MIKLNISGKTWLDLGEGQKVLSKTPSLYDFLAAGHDEDAKSISGSALGNMEDAAYLFVARKLAKTVIIGWSGICDEDENPIEFSADALEAFAGDIVAVALFLDAYMARLKLEDAEKNASALSLNGNSAGAQTIAEAAETAAPTAQA